MLFSDICVFNWRAILPLSHLWGIKNENSTRKKKSVTVCVVCSWKLIKFWEKTRFKIIENAHFQFALFLLVDATVDNVKCEISK